MQSEQVVAENIRALRQDRSWRLEDLSAELDRVGYPMSVKVLSKTENCLRSISTNDLVAFSRAFGVGVDQLLTPRTIPDDLYQALTTLSHAGDAFDHMLEQYRMVAARLDAAELRLRDAERAVSEIASGVPLSRAELLARVGTRWGAGVAHMLAETLRED